MSSNKASMMVGHDRFELSTNGLKVRSESVPNQSDGPREIYGQHSLGARIGAGLAGCFTEAAAAIALCLAPTFSAAVAPSADPIPFVQVAAVNGACTVPYDLQDGAELHVHCYTVAIVADPVAVVETGSPAVSATVVRTFRKPAGAWVVLRGAANGTARIVLVDAAKFRRAPMEVVGNGSK